MFNISIGKQLINNKDCKEHSRKTTYKTNYEPWPRLVLIGFQLPYLGHFPDSKRLKIIG